MAGNMKEIAEQSIANQTVGKVLTKQDKNRKGILAMLDSAKGEIAKALPRHMTVERIIRVTRTAVTRNPGLLDCSPITIVSAVIQASQLGLEPDGALGHGYLVPFRNKKTGKKEAQFIPGYRGLVDLAYRSDRLASIHADVVRDDDVFEHEFGSNGHLKHIPGDKHGTPVSFYCYTKLVNGGESWTVMSLADVNKVKAQSKAKSGPWETHYVEMGIKTVIRRHAKLMPMSIEMATALDNEDQIEYGDSLMSAVSADAEVIIEDPKKIENKPPKKKTEVKQDPSVDPKALMEAHNEYTIACGALDSVAGREHANKCLYDLFKSDEALKNASIKELVEGTKKINIEIKHIQETGELK